MLWARNHFHMSVSLFSSVLLACSLAFSPVNTEPAESTTHTLTIKVHEGGQFVIDDAVFTRDTVLNLSNAHVATLAEAGKSLYTVTQPDGEIFYKGDFTIAVQSVSAGTTKIQLQDGEAMLTKIVVVEE